MDGLLASALCPELRIGGPIGIDCLRSRWVLTPGAFGPYCIHTTHPLGYVVSEEITPVVARQNPKPPICFRPFFLESISNRFRCHPPNLVHGYRTSIPTGPQVYLLSSDTTTMGFPPEMFYHFWV